MAPVDPLLSVTGPEWQIAPVAPVAADVPGADAGSAAAGGGFAGALGRALDSVAGAQRDAATEVQAMVTGQSTDPTQAVMALERARLSMQLAGQLRTKAVEAFQDVFHTQV